LLFKIIQTRRIDKKKIRQLKEKKLREEADSGNSNEIQILREKK